MFIILQKHFLKNQAFSLIEMLVTISIIGIISAIAIPQYQSYKEISRVADLEVSIGIVSQALKSCLLLHNDLSSCDTVKKLQIDLKEQARLITTTKVQEGIKSTITTKEPVQAKKFDKAIKIIGYHPYQVNNQLIKLCFSVIHTLDNINPSPNTRARACADSGGRMHVCSWLNQGTVPEANTPYGNCEQGVCRAPDPRFCDS